jgi:hypothetical protein
VRLGKDQSTGTIHITAHKTRLTAVRLASFECAVDPHLLPVTKEAKRFEKSETETRPSPRCSRSVMVCNSMNRRPYSRKVDIVTALLPKYAR